MRFGFLARRTRARGFFRARIRPQEALTSELMFLDLHRVFLAPYNSGFDPGAETVDFTQSRHGPRRVNQ
jgi:hypothetical protein